MNIFAGTFSLPKNIDISTLDFDIIQVSETSYFIMGWDENINTSKWIVDFLGEQLGVVEEYNISIDSEGNLEILMSETQWEVYEQVVFSGPNTVFDDILERFSESNEAICVREWKTSPFGNREVIVDFLY